MSIRLMAAVFDLDVPAAEKLVLLAMADHARDDGTGCYPSIETLARKTSQTRRGVQKVMRRLEQKGLIIPSNLSRGHRSTEYRITLENREQGSLFATTQPRTGFAVRHNPTANLSASNREPGSPEPLRTIREEKTPDAAHPADRRHPLLVEFASRAFHARNGQLPTWTGKDFRNLRELLTRAPAAAQEDLERRFTAYLASTDPFIVRNGYSLSIFCMRYDALANGPILQQGGPNGTGQRSGVRQSGALPTPAGKYDGVRPAHVVASD